MAETESYTLSNLMDELQFVIRSSFDHTYWVIAEVANVSGSPNGHMYMELVEKSGQQIIAKARANLWSSKKNQIIAAFEDITRQSIKNGMNLLLQVTVDFHAVYGLSLQIHDIDPAYSLGELERQRQETIKKLEAEGLLEFNKQYVLPPVIQNLAIISSETAAGYQDFINQLTHNKQGYTFRTQLFPAIMQGDQAVSSIIKALDKLEKAKKEFDVIIVIRGGGSNLDLACFDDYTLNARLAQAFFPIFSGIGHERDNSVTDMIAHTRLKTPTAVAEYILQYNFEFENQIQDLFNDILDFSKDILEEQNSILEKLSRNMAHSSRTLLSTEQMELKQNSFEMSRAVVGNIHKNQNQLLQNKKDIGYLVKSIKEKKNYDLQSIRLSLQSEIKDFFLSQKEMMNHSSVKLLKSKDIIKKQHEKLDFLQQIIHVSDPQLLLKKGFSITRQNGKVITDLSQLEASHELETQLYQGKLISKIIKTINNE